MGRPPGYVKKQRDHIENEILAPLSAVAWLLDVLGLRTRQACERHPDLGDLLGPAEEQIEDAEQNIARARDGAAQMLPKEGQS